MAGGLLGKPNPKNHVLANSSEVLKNNSQPYDAPKKPFNGLKGILGLGQTIDINKPTEKSSLEHFFVPSHVEREQIQIVSQQQEHIKQELQQLREEIKKLIHSTDNLDKDVQKAALDPIIDATEYQLKFFTRIRLFIANFRKNISEADSWVEAFSAKKNKKNNAFWNKARNKRTGGEQYLFSNEHSAARSVS